MKLLYASATTVDGTTPESKRIEGLAAELQSRGSTLTLLAPGSFSPPGVRRLTVPASRVAREPVLSLLLSKELVRHRPTHMYLSSSIFIGALSARILGAQIPTIIELSMDTLAPLDTATPGATQVVRHRQLSTVIANAAQTLTFDPGVPELAERLGLGAVQLISSIDTNSLPRMSPPEARGALGLPEGLRMISLVGPLGPELRLDVLADAHRRLTGVGLLVMGNGPQARFVEAMTMTARPSTPVLLCDDRPEADEVLALAAGEVSLALSSVNAAQTAKRALAMGRRVVWACADAPPAGIDELYAGHDALIAAHPRSTDELEAAMRKLLDRDKDNGPLPSDAVEQARRAIGGTASASALSSILEQASI